MGVRGAEKGCCAESVLCKVGPATLFVESPVVVKGAGGLQGGAMTVWLILGVTCWMCGTCQVPCPIGAIKITHIQPEASS